MLINHSHLPKNEPAVTQDPPHIPDQRTKEDVTYFAGIGLRPFEIAGLVDISKRQLQDHYQRELALGPAEANRKVCENVFNMAISPRYPSVAMFWAKARCGFKTNAASWSPTSFVTLEEPVLDDLDDNHPRFEL